MALTFTGSISIPLLLLTMKPSHFPDERPNKLIGQLRLIFVIFQEPFVELPDVLLLSWICQVYRRRTPPYSHASYRDRLQS